LLTKPLQGGDRPRSTGDQGRRDIRDRRMGRREAGRRGPILRGRGGTRKRTPVWEGRRAAFRLRGILSPKQAKQGRPSFFFFAVRGERSRLSVKDDQGHVAASWVEGTGTRSARARSRGFSNLQNAPRSTSSGDPVSRAPRPEGCWGPGAFAKRPGREQTRPGTRGWAEKKRSTPPRDQNRAKLRRRRAKGSSLPRRSSAWSSMIGSSGRGREIPGPQATSGAYGGARGRWRTEPTGPGTNRLSFPPPRACRDGGRRESGWGLTIQRPRSARVRRVCPFGGVLRFPTSAFGRPRCFSRGFFPGGAPQHPQTVVSVHSSGGRGRTSRAGNPRRGRFGPPRPGGSGRGARSFRRQTATA